MKPAKFTVVIKGPDGSPCGFPAIGIDSHEVLVAAIELALSAAREAQAAARNWMAAPVLLPPPVAQPVAVHDGRRGQKRSEETKAKMRAAWARRKAAQAA